MTLLMTLISFALRQFDSQHGRPAFTANGIRTSDTPGGRSSTSPGRSSPPGRSGPAGRSASSGLRTDGFFHCDRDAGLPWHRALHEFEGTAFDYISLGPFECRSQLSAY